jgi:hypothetical protein
MSEYTPADSCDPNRLFDALLCRFRLEDDETLSHVLDVESYLIARIRQHHYPVESSLLIRINEVFGINVRELRQLMGDRRQQYRLHTDPHGTGAPEKETSERINEGAEREKFRRLMENDDAGMPSFVQWK